MPKFTYTYSLKLPASPPFLLAPASIKIRIGGYSVSLLIEWEFGTKISGRVWKKFQKTFFIIPNIISLLWIILYNQSLVLLMLGSRSQHCQCCIDMSFVKCLDFFGHFKKTQGGSGKNSSNFSGKLKRIGWKKTQEFFLNLLILC